MTPKKYYIKDLVAGQSISEFFALAQAQRKEAKNGPYWQLTLADCTGTMEARIWHPLSADIPELKAEQFVRVTGHIAPFKDQLQMNVSELLVVDNLEQGLVLSDFLPSSIVPPQELFEQMLSFLNVELHFVPWRDLCENIFADEDIRTAFMNAPGAKSIHHAYAGGLLEHTLGIMKICKALAELYPGVDKEILLVAALCHDLGKAFELSQGISREYTDEGRLIGHIQMGLERLEPFLRQTTGLPQELILHLKHIIISHHGELEFGSPRRPKTAEAFILHFADNLDAKINTVHMALADPQDREPGQWSEFHRILGRYLYQPMRTPQHKPQKSSPEPTTNNEDNSYFPTFSVQSDTQPYIESQDNTQQPSPADKSADHQKKKQNKVGMLNLPGF